MNTDTLLNALPDWPYLAAAGVAVVVVLTGLAILLRRKGREKLARRLTTLATVLGLCWSAQGMWDTAVHRYDQTVLVASVLFVVFEVMMAARMLKAHEYRNDYGRRGRHVRAVWVIALIMAVVVAAGEGWGQAPGRLAIPLLVAYGWYVDLTADDDPETKPITSWNWTLRNLLLAIGAIRPGKRDAHEIDRDRLRARMTKLAFRIEHGAPTLNDLLNRKIRLAKMKTLATDADLAEVRARLARSNVALTESAPAPEPPARKTAPKPPPATRLPSAKLPQGTHERVGRTMKREALETDAITVHRKSITPERPQGMTAAELAALYAPALGMRTAEGFAAKSRKMNGHDLSTVEG